MSHLLMIESWVGPTGRHLPPTIAGLGHRYTFVTRSRQHYLDARTKQIHPLFEHADHVLTTETNDVPALIAFLQRQHDILHFDGVVTVCDYYVDTVANVAHALKLPHAFSANVATERRKHLVRQALQRAGLPNPAFAITTSWAETREAGERIGYPLIVKPSDLASSAFVRLARNDTELHDAFTALDGFRQNFRAQPREPIWLLEEYMIGEEVSVEACTYRNETTIIGITDKSVTGSPYFIEDGHMFPARLDPALADAIGTLVRQALQAVGHDHGITHTEVKITSDGPRIVEINPRPPGNYIVELVQRVTGIDLLAAHAHLALDRPPDLTRQTTGVASAAIAFLVPSHSGLVTTLRGVEDVDADPHVVRSTFSAIAGTEIAAPIDNACYLGHVVTVDQIGQDARRVAERALGRIELTIAESPSASLVSDTGRNHL
jgi:biotin carboxylase